MVENISDNNFDQATSEGVVLIDFYANWCNPCKMIAPILDELSNELPEGMKIIKVDVDENPESSMKFKVRSIPTFVIMKDGEVMMIKLGATPDKDFYFDLMKEV